MTGLRFSKISRGLIVARGVQGFIDHPASLSFGLALLDRDCLSLWFRLCLSLLRFGRFDFKPDRGHDRKIDASRMQSVEAFGGGLPFATVGAVYLVGSAVAQAAPTPGGLGAVEAALIAGLVAAGLDNTVAVPAVFFYRLFTFWVPILPGWLCFQWLQRNDYL